MPAIASAYGVRLDSLGPALDGGDLIPASAAAPVPLPDPGPPPAVRLSGVLSDRAIVAAAPHATAIMGRLRDLAAEGKVQPSGEDVFARRPAGIGGSPHLDVYWAAGLWKDHAYMPEDERAWLIAALHTHRETTARPDTNVG